MWVVFVVVSSALSLSRAGAAVFSFTPTADTYVSNKSPAATNGAGATMVSNNSGDTRVMLVRFDLSSLSSQINAAQISRYTLTFTGNSGSASRAVKVFGLIAGESWVEGTTNWSNAPGVIQSFTSSPWSGVQANYLKFADLYGGGTVLNTFTPIGGSGSVTAFDVTSGAVFNFLAADTDKIVTFVIAVDDPIATGGLIFSSKEAATGAPVLTVTTIPPPPPPNPTVVTFQPVADTYVNNKSTTTNYGSLTSVAINNNVNGHRVALMRFDLSSITATISNLRLDLTGTGFQVGKNMKIYGLVNGESWAENTVTWANGPGVNHAWKVQTGGLADYLNTADLYGGGTVLAQFTATVNSGTLAAFNVSSGPVLDFVNADSDKIVTFLIAEDDPADDPGSAICTREAPAQTPLLTVSCLPTSTAPPLIRVLLLAGQSNALGQASAATLSSTLLAPQTGVLLYTYVNGQVANSDGTLGALTTLHPGATTVLGDFGPEVTLGQQLAPLLNQVPGTKLAIIKYAVGGTSLNTDWKGGGTGTTAGDGVFYQTFQQVVANGLAKLAATYTTSTIQLGGMVWVQGEQDTNTDANATAYGGRLANFIADVRATYGASLPFFFSRLSSQQTYYPINRPTAYQAIRQGQQNVAASVAGAYMLNADGTAFTVGADGIHFDTAGQQALGTAFAALVAGVLNPQTFTKNDNATQTLTGIQNYTAMTANAGVLNVNGTVGSGTSTVSANNAGTVVNFGVSQTVSSLTVGAGAVVRMSQTTSSSFGETAAGQGGAVPASLATFAEPAPTALCVGIAPCVAGVRISWNSVPGQSYSIQTSTDLVAWSQPFSVGQTGQWIDTDVAGVGVRYYRVLPN
jgi:hypothetical protein